MNAAIINIGDELLIGQTINTNASWIGEQLTQQGVFVVQGVVIPDNLSVIQETISAFLPKVDLIIMTGGLGPTKDDITVKALCPLFDAHLVFSEDVYADIAHFFALRNREVTELNRLQAMVPDKATVLRNSLGTAPGLIFKEKGASLFVFPGVPHEMKKLFIDNVIPFVQSVHKGDLLVNKTILTQGIAESYLAERISDWEDNLPSHLSLAYLPSPGIVKLRLTAKGQEEEQLYKDIQEQEEALKPLIADYIFGYGDETIEQLVAQLLVKKNQTLALAESCTGGYLSELITAMPGCSSFYKGGVVAYDNQVKIDVLSVSPSVLEEFGAVSEQVVKQMAENARLIMQTDYAIAVSGIAGPSGGTPEKPVGTIYIGLASPKGVHIKRCAFGAERVYNIRTTASTAFHLLLRELS